MKQMLIAFALLLLAIPAFAQNKPPRPTSLREVLLAELRSTHTEAEWFVPVNTAVKGLTAEQANWTDGKGNHSVGQLTYHLLFWNQRNLALLKGEKLEKFTGNNDETFDKFDSKSWEERMRSINLNADTNTQLLSLFFLFSLSSMVPSFQ